MLGTVLYWSLWNTLILHKFLLILAWDAKRSRFRAQSSELKAPSCLVVLWLTFENTTLAAAVGSVAITDTQHVQQRTQEDRRRQTVGSRTVCLLTLPRSTCSAVGSNPQTCKKGEPCGTTCQQRPMGHRWRVKKTLRLSIWCVWIPIYTFIIFRSVRIHTLFYFDVQIIYTSPRLRCTLTFELSIASIF